MAVSADEFSLWHKIGFLTEWQLYAQQVEGESWLGEKIDQAKVEKLSGKTSRRTFGYFLSLFVDNLTLTTITEQQVGQLYELMMAIKSRREGGEGEGQESP